MIKEKLYQKEPVVYQTLENALKKDRLAHAFLFEGVRDPLKLDAAFLLAQSIIEGKSDFACETCERCERIKRNKYFDLLYIDGTKELIVKEDIEHLFKEFSKTALEKSGKKVYIINNINHASLKVLNMILKFMEEPSNHNTFGIFISDHIDGLLPTIVSRCQIIRFKNQDERAMIEAYLEDGFDEKDAELLTKILRRYEAIDLNDPAFINAKDFVELTIENFNKLDYLPILFQHDFAGAFKKSENDVFKECQNYYLDMMLLLLEESFSDPKNPLYSLKNDLKAHYFETYQKAKDHSFTNMDRKLLFDQLAFEILSYKGERE